MNINRDFILNLDHIVIDVFMIYEVHGSGTQGDPLTEGKLVKTIRSTELEAWVVCEAMNIEKYGFNHSRTSWESPMYWFKKLEVV